MNKYIIIAVLLVNFFLLPLTYAAGPTGGPEAPAGTPAATNYGQVTTSSAGSCGNIKDFASFVNCIRDGIIQPLIYLLFALAIVYFLYGVLQYIRKGGDEDSQREARSMMIFGIIAIAVMVSVWGLVNFLTNSFKLDNASPIVPKISLLK